MSQYKSNLVDMENTQDMLDSELGKSEERNQRLNAEAFKPQDDFIEKYPNYRNNSIVGDIAKILPRKKRTKKTTIKRKTIKKCSCKKKK